MTQYKILITSYPASTSVASLSNFCRSWYDGTARHVKEISHMSTALFGPLPPIITAPGKLPHYKANAYGVEVGSRLSEVTYQMNNVTNVRVPVNVVVPSTRDI